MQKRINRIYRLSGKASNPVVRLAGKRTRVWAICGHVGAGKTAMAVAIMLYFVRLGYKPYANIELKGELSHYENIKDTAFVDRVPKNGKPKVILVDEVGVSGSSIHEKEFQKTMTLVRKLVGEDVVILLTTPLIADIEKRLKGHVDMIGIPQIGENEAGEPVGMRVRFREKVDRDGIVIGFRRATSLTVTNAALGVDVWEVLNSYETGEVAEGLRDGTYKQVWKRFKKYAGDRKTPINVLALMIRNVTNLPLSRCKEYAQSIRHGFDPFVEFEEPKKKKKKEEDED